jgi:hypothetical protein
MVTVDTLVRLAAGCQGGLPSKASGRSLPLLRRSGESNEYVFKNKNKKKEEEAFTATKQVEIIEFRSSWHIFSLNTLALRAEARQEEAWEEEEAFSLSLRAEARPAGRTVSERRLGVSELNAMAHGKTDEG